MPKSSPTDDFTKSSDKQPRSLSHASTPAPLHFSVHKPGCHFESCCGVCNLFPVASMASGAILSGMTGAGILLIIVALTENCRAMLVYLLVATMVWISIMSLAITKIGRACIRFKDAPKIKDEQHRLANLACVSGLFTFLGAVIYFFSFIVVFSFYHFRYVRRAILLHEAECE
ncbi:uncharacterized protein LOC113225435 isoform X2 [Hyposmocoma kahamanoa]|uniref:uncharacterized protein LOC113225435 isoform X2 n=1 Tax=Hyposmocoma kahamanoa TaxID=1477025 RepID=UPI000E6D9D72|nr:uncharacterized protein LOC113225435 isoform X2 [Hyposmocoma kahamanoa]